MLELVTVFSMMMILWLGYKLSQMMYGWRYEDGRDEWLVKYSKEKCYSPNPYYDENSNLIK